MSRCPACDRDSTHEEGCRYVLPEHRADTPAAPTTQASQRCLRWIAFVEKVDDPAGNTIYDELRLNFLPAIEAEARFTTAEAHQDNPDWDAGFTAGYEQGWKDKNCDG